MVCIYLKHHEMCEICRCSYLQVQVEVMGSHLRVSKHKYTFVLMSADRPSSKRLSPYFLDFSTFLKIPNLTVADCLEFAR